MCQTKEQAASQGNVDGCCEMNRFGYYNDAQMITGEYKKIDGNELLDNGQLDDGGDKLGLCEGYEITGSTVYLTGKNIYQVVDWVENTGILISQG